MARVPEAGWISRSRGERSPTWQRKALNKNLALFCGLPELWVGPALPLPSPRPYPQHELRWLPRGPQRL